MPQISLIIPTVNEAENLPPLFAKIAVALNGRTWEALIVDDASTDDEGFPGASIKRDRKSHV